MTMNPPNALLTSWSIIKAWKNPFLQTYLQKINSIDTSSKGQHKLANSMTSTPPLSMTGFNPIGAPISAWFLHSCSNALSLCEGDHLPGCFPDNTARAANAAFHPAGNSWEACYDRVCNMPFLQKKKKLVAMKKKCKLKEQKMAVLLQVSFRDCLVWHPKNSSNICYITKILQWNITARCSQIELGCLSRPCFQGVRDKTSPFTGTTVQLIDYIFSMFDLLVNPASILHTHN